MNWFKKEKSFDQKFSEYKERMASSKFGATINQLAEEIGKMHKEFKELELDTPAVYDHKFLFLYTEILKLRDKIKGEK